MIYKIADLNVKLNNKYPFTDKFCNKYLTDSDTYDIEASVTDEEFALERVASPNFSDGYIENICLYRSLCNQLPKLGRFLLHSSVIEYEGNAYAFLGKSGAGKSTHTGLWLEYLENAKILNGDKPIIGFDGKTFTAYGTPWNGKENRGYNGKAPLKALCFIEKSKENEIERLSVSETTMRIFTQILLPTDELAAATTLELVDRLVTDIPAYILKCDISENAVKTSFPALTGKNYEEKI